MPTSETDAQPVRELDVRPLRRPDKHPTIFATYTDLPSGGSFVLINDHDPKHLREEFEADHVGSYQWEYLNREPKNWRIKITKLATTPLPRVLSHTADLTADTAESDLTGVVWKLEVPDRDLDSNIIAFSPGGSIDGHIGPDLDIIIHILTGSGQLTTELGTLELTPGDLLWLPRGSQRQFTAGPGGLRYLTVHQRRQALPLDISRTAADG